jgi:hypothetical protein
MNIPKKYIIQEGTNRGKLNQTALQVELANNDRGQPHPKVKGLVLVRYKSCRNNTQQWGTPEQLQKRRDADRRWDVSNPELKRGTTYRWRARHPTRALESAKKNRKTRKENGKCRAYRSRPEVKKRHRIRNREYTKKNLFLVSTRSRYSKLIPDLHRHWEADELLGADDKTVRKHIEDQFQDGMTWDNHGEWHIDHILPCKMKHPLTGEDIFDLTKPSDQKLLFNYRNLQPLWESENCSKQDKIPWYVLLTILINNYKTITV